MVKTILVSGIMGSSMILASVLMVFCRSRKEFKLSEESNVMILEDLLLIFSIGIENI